jgi:hypothetical protein
MANARYSPDSGRSPPSSVLMPDKDVPARNVTWPAPGLTGRTAFGEPGPVSALATKATSSAIITSNLCVPKTLNPTIVVMKSAQDGA